MRATTVATFLTTASAQQPHGSNNLHTVFTSECNNKQFDWFTVGVYESFRKLGAQGSITRLLACNEEDLKSYKGLNLGPTFVHPNYRHNPLNGDTSASYNKPASVMHFSREANFTEEFVLFIDADMVLHRPIDPVALGAKKGVVVSEHVPYMVGSKNDMAKQFLPPEAVPKAQPVGWYHIFHRDDLKRIAPLWLEYCGRVRMEPERYWSINGSIPKDIPTGDAYVQFGKAPWISEMYGYSFGSAMAGVDHIITHGVVRYPGEVGGAGSDGPYILHYGIDFTIDHTYNWNKMSYQKLDLYACKGLFFGAPPAGSGSPRHVAMRFVVNTLNSAFCDFYHSDRCDASTKAHLVPCPPHTRPVEAPCAVHDLHCCKDQQPTCWQWALDEQCEANKAFMEGACRLSCGLCSARADAAETALPLERPTMQPLDTSSRLTKVAASLSDARGAAEAHGTKRAAVLGLSQSAVGEAVLERAAADEEAARATARATGATDSDASPSSPVAAATTAEVAPVHSHPQANAPAHTYTDIAPAHVQNAPAHTHTDIAPTHVQNAPAHTYTDIAPTHVQNAPAHMHTDIAPAHRVQAPSHHPLPAVLHHSASPSHAPSPIVGHGKTAHALHAPGGSNLPSHAAVPRPGAPRSQSPAAETVLDDLRRVAEEHKASYAPGHVPQWLDKQAHRGTAPVESHSPRAGGSEGDTAVEAEAAEGRASAAVLHAEHRRAASVDEHAAADDEHDGHRWLLLTMSGVSIALIVLWLARWLRIGFGRPRKRRAGEANFPFDSFRGFDTSHRF